MNTSFATLNGVDRVEYFGSLEKPTPILGQVITHRGFDWNITGTVIDRATGKMKFSCTRVGMLEKFWKDTGTTRETHEIRDGKIIVLNENGLADEKTNLKNTFYQVWFHNGIKDTHLWFESVGNETYEDWQQIARDGFSAIEELCSLENWQWLVGRIFKGIAYENEIALGRIERYQMLKEQL